VRPGALPLNTLGTWYSNLVLDTDRQYSPSHPGLAPACILLTSVQCCLVAWHPRSTALDCLHGKCVWFINAGQKGVLIAHAELAPQMSLLITSPKTACTVRAWCCAIAVPRPTSVHRSVCTYSRCPTRARTIERWDPPPAPRHARARSENGPCTMWASVQETYF